MDYEKAYKAVLKTATQWIKDGCTDKEKICLECVFPELRESEDEIMMKNIRLALLSVEDAFWRTHGLTAKEAIAYLEKQKNAFENGRQFGIMQEQARQELEWTDEKQKEQKPNIELIQKSWYMEGYKDHEHNREPMWIVKTGEGGPKYEPNLRYGQMLAQEQKPTEKQDYSGLTDLERVIHRGFLSAGVGNVPVTIIKETAKECLAQTNPAWSEEDEKMLQGIIERGQSQIQWCDTGLRPEQVSWLKSIRPSWKPSDQDELMKLKYAGTSTKLD